MRHAVVNVSITVCYCECSHNLDNAFNFFKSAVDSRLDRPACDEACWSWQDDGSHGHNVSPGAVVVVFGAVLDACTFAPKLCINLCYFYALLFLIILQVQSSLGLHIVDAGYTLMLSSYAYRNCAKEANINILK